MIHPTGFSHVPVVLTDLNATIRTYRTAFAMLLVEPALHHAAGVGEPHVADAFVRTPAVPEYQTDTRIPSLFVAETPRMGIEMSVHLASATSMAEGFALNRLVVTDAIMECCSRPTAIVALGDASATDCGIDVPPISNQTWQWWPTSCVGR